jgi:hypothetical protein
VRGSRAPVIESRWGGDRSAEAGMCSVGAEPLVGVRARIGRGGLGRGRACIGCDGERDAAKQADLGLCDSDRFAFPDGPVYRTIMMILSLCTDNRTPLVLYLLYGRAFNFIGKNMKRSNSLIKSPQASPSKSDRNNMTTPSLGRRNSH